MPTQPDDIVLNPDGTATLYVAGSRHNLRRPLVREYRKALEILNGAQDEAARVRARGRKEAKEPEVATDADADDKADAFRVAVRTAAQDITDAVWKVATDAYGEIFAMLADKPVTADPEDWPAFLLSLQPLADLIGHWRRRPLAPGSA